MLNFWSKSNAQTESKTEPGDAQALEGETPKTEAGPPVTTTPATTTTTEPEATAANSPVAEEAVKPTKRSNGVVATSDGSPPRPSTDARTSEVQSIPDASTPPAHDNLNAPKRARRISFRSFSFAHGLQKQHHPTPAHISHQRQENKESEVELALTKKKLVSHRDAKKVDKTAFALRNLILGPIIAAPEPSTSKPKNPAVKVKPVGQETLARANGQLLAPKQANKVIAKLRTLPVPEAPELPGAQYLDHKAHSHAEGPIHAVCLDCTESEADKFHFAQLAAAPEVNVRTFKRPSSPSRAREAPPSPSPAPASSELKLGEQYSIASADLSTLVPMLQSLRLITLVSSPDFGFGQPVGGDGPLAGAVPSAGVFGNGLQEITGQLLALGFATSKAVFPDHSGVYPPMDRMSILTCALP